MSRFTLAAAILAASTATATANEFAPALQTFLDSEIRGWAAEPVLVEAIRAQNGKTAAYSQAQIDELDRTWRAEVGSEGSAIINGVLDNAAADFLRTRVEAAGGAITEVFIMDSRGLNVAASAVTSDYWQGDEEKFSETFPKGAGAVHLSEVEFDESSQTFQSQISLSIVDPATNEVVGAMTVGVDVEALM